MKEKPVASGFHGWSGGVWPGAGDYAIINQAGGYFVEVHNDLAVGALSVNNSGVILDVNSATFTAGTFNTLGEVDVFNGGTLDVLVSGTFAGDVFGSGT